jgi:hypothetical protein
VRISLNFEFETGKAKAFMSDYIHDFKKKRDVEATNQKRQEELRLHDAGIVQVKGPTFWQCPASAGNGKGAQPLR